MDNAYDMGRKRGQEESRKEIERLHKVCTWWRAATWRFVKHHSKTIEEAEDKLQNFEKDCMMGKGEFESFKQALKEK